MRTNKNLKRKVRNSYLISTISISLVLFLLGSVGYMMFTALDLSERLRESITATVELSPSVDAEQRDVIRRTLATYPFAGEVRFSSKEEKIEDDNFREMFGLEFEKILEENPLMDSFEVKLSGDVSDVKQLEDFSREMMEIVGVDRVSYPALLLEQVHTTVGNFQLAVLIFGAVLLFISLILLNNTIRLAIFSKRTIINTMKLVGATKWFIVRPFLWSGIVSGFWAGVLASLFFGGAVYSVMETLEGVILEEELLRALYAMGAMVAGGMIISLLFTWISVSRFVNMKSNKIHLY